MISPDTSVSALTPWLEVGMLTLPQAAHLALGVAPDSPPNRCPNGLPAMLSAMEHAVLMGGLQARVASMNGVGGTPLPSSFDCTRHKIQDAFLSHRSIREWLQRNGREAFFFDQAVEDWPGSCATPSPGGRWPWGAHETDLLSHLAGAAERYWARYDPSDPTTAPLSADVEKWLEERGVSRKSAKAIATILRADDVRSGPRKQGTD